MADNNFCVEYPFQNNIGHTIEYYPNTKQGQKKAIQDLKFYKSKLHKIIEEQAKQIKELENNYNILEQDYDTVMDSIKYE